MLERMIFTAIDGTIPPRTLVRRDGKGNVEIFRQADWAYWIPEQEIGTRRGIIRWVRHLSDKNWVTTEHIRQLIDLGFLIGSKK